MATTLNTAKWWFWRILNAMQGCGFHWSEKADEFGPGLVIWKGTCPYPLQNDWSAKACIKAGDCGCDERAKAAR